MRRRTRSSTRLPTKVSERTYLDAALNLGCSFPSGDIYKCETPDFIVRSEKTVCGIEVTRFAWKDKTAHLRRNLFRLIEPWDLQRILDKKAERLKGYYLDGSLVWLLIVLDRQLPSCYGWVTPELLEHTYTSPFFGVTLLDYRLDKCWNLKT